MLGKGDETWIISASNEPTKCRNIFPLAKGYTKAVEIEDKNVEIEYRTCAQWMKMPPE
jgi:hypothetical protein